MQSTSWPERATDALFAAKTTAAARGEQFLRRHVVEVMTKLHAELLAELTTPPQAKGKAPPKPADNRTTIPPLPEWVTAYSKEIGYPMDGEAWCDAYAQKGWIVGRTKMKDWKCAVQNWKRSRYGLAGGIYLGGGKHEQTRSYDRV